MELEQGDGFDDLDFPAFDSPGSTKGMDKLKDTNTVGASTTFAGSRLDFLYDFDDFEKI